MSPAAPPQDLPPAGGFPKTIRYRRFLPKRGPSGAAIFGAAIALTAAGWYRVSLANEERREIRREKTWARIHLIPLLQAETDRDTFRRLHHARAREAEIMKDVPGWVAGDLKAPVRGIGAEGTRGSDEQAPVYNTPRYVAPQMHFLPPEEGQQEHLPWYKTPL